MISNNALHSFPEYLYNSKAKKIIQFDKLTKKDSTKTLGVSFFEHTNLIEIKLKDIAWYGEFDSETKNPEIEFIYITESFELFIKNLNQPLEKVLLDEIKFNDDIVSDRLYYTSDHKIFDIKNDKYYFEEEIDFDIDPSATELIDQRFLLIGNQDFDAAIFDLKENKIILCNSGNEAIYDIKYYTNYSIFKIIEGNSIWFIDINGTELKSNEEILRINREGYLDNNDHEANYSFDGKTYLFGIGDGIKNENYLEYISKESDGKILKIQVYSDRIDLVLISA